MVKDTYTATVAAGPNMGPMDLTAVGNTLYFTAPDATNGRELWKSDGTSSGTVMVKDIRPGTGSSSWPTELTVIGSTLYIRANDGTNGYELWKSDGTSAGTVMVKDINSGTAASSLDSNPNFIAVGNTLYFEANDGTNGNELWKSDGTSSGTVMINNIHSGSGSSSPSELTLVNNTLYFTADDGANGDELWSILLTSAGNTISSMEIIFS